MTWWKCTALRALKIKYYEIKLFKEVSCYDYLVVSIFYICFNFPTWTSARDLLGYTHYCNFASFTLYFICEQSNITSPTFLDFTVIPTKILRTFSRNILYFSDICSNFCKLRNIHQHTANWYKLLQASANFGFGAVQTCANQCRSRRMMQNQ